jgi:RHS repeat-associated protein
MGECTERCEVGNPTNVATGNKLQVEADIEALEPDGLAFTRYYNSSPLVVTSRMGPGWRHTFDRQLMFAGNPSTTSTTPITASILRADGRIARFNVSSEGVFPAYLDMTEKLVFQADGTWLFTTEDDTTETYLAPSVSTGGFYASKLDKIRFRSGIIQTLTYDLTGRPIFVEDNFGHALELLYDGNGHLNKVSRVYQPGDPEASTSHYVEYFYDGNGILSSVQYPGVNEATSLAPTRGYDYVPITSPNGISHQYLSAIRDETTGQVRSRWEYDGQGRVIKAAKTSGELEVFNFDYTSNGTTVTSTNGTATTTDTYNFEAIQGVPRLASYAGAKSVTTTRDPFTGRTTSRTEGASQTVLEHDAGGRVTRKTEAANTPRARTTRLTWHPTLDVPTEVKEYANGTGSGTPVRVETFALDTVRNNGAVLARTEQEPSSGISRTWTISRTPYGRPLIVDGPASYSDISRYAYYSCFTGYECGRLKSYTNERGKITNYSNYNVHGLPRTIVDPNGLTTQIGYDLRGRIISRTEGTETTTFSYWPNGLLKRVVLPDGAWTERSYNAAHWLTQIADQSGNKIVIGRDARGNPTQESYKNADEIVWLTRNRAYDVHSRLTGEQSATKPNGLTSYNYGTDGKLDTVTAPLGRGVDYGYDELDRITSLVSPVSGSSLTSIQYDLADRVTAVTDPNGSTTAYQYDGFGALTQLASPDTGTTTYSYTAVDGRLATSTDARGVTTTYQFDSMGRPTAQSWSGTGQNIQFFYDAAGVNGINQLTSTKVNSTTDLSWVYDLNGRVTTRTSQVGSLSLPLQYGYSSGRLTSMTTPAQQAVTYEYPAGSGGKPRIVKVNGTSILSGASYYPYGPVLTWTWANAQTELRARNSDGLPSAIGGTAGTGVTLGYDDALRINNQTVGDNSAASWSYGYDTKDQLTSAVPGAGAALGWTYDLNGNRSSQSGATPSSYGYSTGTNRLSSLDGVSIVTDAVGNITNDGNGTTFVYGPRNRMTSSTNAQGTTTYSYNALGERVKKSGPAGTIVFAYDEEGHLIGEYTSAGAMLQEIVWFDGLPVASLRPAASGGGIEIFNISSDHLGTPRIIRRATDGVVVWRWDSDPFGNGSPNENPSGVGTFAFNLRFPGQYADAETGLNYNYFRDYNPKTGRYTQSDLIGLRGGLNTYYYGNNSPTMAVDPTGENPLLLAVLGRAAGAALIDVASQAVGNLWEGCNLFVVDNYDWTSVGIAAGLGSVLPGLLTTRAALAESRSATVVLTEQLHNARTANRVAKVARSLKAHEVLREDLRAAYLGTFAFLQVEKTIFPRKCSCKN